MPAARRGFNTSGGGAVVGFSGEVKRGGPRHGGGDSLVLHCSSPPRDGVAAP